MDYINNEGKEVKMLNSICLKNILSFNQEGIELELKNLNVLIGTNGSGKSNFIEAISLLQTAPTYLASGVRDRGGIATWLHKDGNYNNDKPKPTATIEVITSITSDHKDYNIPIRHKMSFTESNHRFELVDEVIEDSKKTDHFAQRPFFYYRFQNNRPVIVAKIGKNKERHLERDSIDPEQSILSQRKDPDLYPEIAKFSNAYEQIKIYREWTFGRYSKPREPQKADMRNDFLEENCQNLALILNKIDKYPPIKNKILEHLKILYPRFTDYSVLIETGNAQIFFMENNISIPATRLSDGTLRYLSLLVALYNPSPASLICIEEPELGLHPDILPTLAEIFKEVSQEKQLIITTHSEILIDALSDTPESVIVCENNEGHTTLERLSRDNLKEWLKEYSLGELWSKGELGGNRFE
ncbi:AAA family ATPase [Helicobacter rodentium]|uniref:AAA family ATPase n=1 Tax=Helicobacter rodentium TaxID=59617 RepID=UPI0023571984|nr:AAA family ATPase [Helicobacter rodentium]